MRFQLFAARLALGILILAALVAAGAIAAVRLALAPYESGIAVMAVATVLGALALIAALAWLTSALRHNDGTAKRTGFIALVGSLFLLTPPLTHVWRSFTTPAIHDATSDPEDPPQFVALARLRKPDMNPAAYVGSETLHFHGENNTADYMLHTYYPDITKPYARLLTTKAKLFWHAFATVKRMGWHIVDFNEAQGRIEATARSFWFGRVSDIVIRVAPAGALGARLDIRSESERGARDYGANIALIKAFFRNL